MVEKVDSVLLEWTNYTKENYNKKIQTLDLHALLNELSKDQIIVLNKINKIRNQTTIKELCDTFSEVENGFGIDKSLKVLHDISISDRYLTYLRILNDKLINLRSLQWLLALQNINKFLQESEKWYQFLYDLYNKLSRYEIQTEKEIYNVQIIEDWGKPGTPMGIEISRQNFERFFDQLTKSSMVENDCIKHLPLSEFNFEELNHILDVALKHDTNIRRAGKSLNIQGDYISLKKVFQPDYQNLGRLLEWRELETLVIFSANTIFIDRDIELVGRKVSVIFISPRWEIIGTRKIDLSGKKGEEPSTTYPAYSSTKSKANDGEHGKPGGPGGNFFGIGEKFINGENLIILANGGAGGCGQKGQDGKNGENALIPTNRPNDIYFKRAVENRRINSETYEVIKGGKGEDGGDGGRGGIGGYAGNILILELTNPSRILKSAERGISGSIGAGGNGGISGFYGAAKKWVPGKVLLDKRDAPGKIGLAGGNVLEPRSPEPGLVLKGLAEEINNFRSYLRENVCQRFKKDSLLQFLDILDSNVNIRHLYDTLAISDELLCLEKQFYALHKKLNILPFYKNLLVKISDYAQNPKLNENSRGFKIFHNFLYTAVLSKINVLQNDSDIYLTVDINRHLQFFEHFIESLNKFQVIKNYSNNYKNSIDIKIEEANHLIDKVIIPEIKNNKRNSDRKINSLISEILTLQKEAESEKQNLVKKKAELPNVMLLSGIFTCVNAFGQMISVLGPTAAAAGFVIQETSSLSAAFLLDNQNIAPQRFQPQASVTTSLQLLNMAVKMVKTEKVTNFRSLLEEMVEEIDNNSEIIKIKKNFDDTVAGIFHINTFQSIENDLRQELIKQEEELSTEAFVVDNKKSHALEKIKKFKIATKLFALGYDIYKRHKNDKVALDAIDNAIESSDNKIKMLKECEEKVHQIIVPLLECMEINLRQTTNNLRENSKVALDVVKWKVQNNLMDVKFQMQKLTRGFTVCDSFQICFEKLYETLTVLIHIYDRIQSYQEQQTLIQYIADVNSAAANTITINDPILLDMHNNIKLSIDINIMLKQYQTLLNAFKQWSFPFAYLYLENDDLLSYHRNDDLINKVKNKTGEIKSNIEKHKRSVNKYDRNTRVAEFQSNYVSSQPFYVWKNELHKDLISELLSGRKVVLKADIMNSPPDKEAIKFNYIDLYFRAVDQSMQSYINETLKGFKVELTHLGNSYYKCSDKIYLIRSDSQTIGWSFEKKVYGEPIDKNIVYDKLKTGDLMLSPYAMWEMKLTCSTRNSSFQSLASLKNGVDLELVGHGSYINKGVNLSDLKVEDFYKDCMVCNY